MPETSQLAGTKVHIKETWVAWRVIRRVARMLAGILVLVLLFYFCAIAPTVVRFVWTDSYGVVVTRDPRTPEGKITAGTQLYAQLDQKHDHLADFKSKLILSITPQNHVSMVNVVYGPDGKLTPATDDKTKKDYIAADGTRTDVPTPDGFFTDADADGKPDPIWLKDQYLVTCVSGYCARHGDKDKPIIMTMGSVIGETSGRTIDKSGRVVDTDKKEQTREGAQAAGEAAENKGPTPWDKVKKETGKQGGTGDDPTGQDDTTAGNAD